MNAGEQSVPMHNMSASSANNASPEMFDLKGQVMAHPWAALGISIAAGYVLGSIGGSAEDEQPQAGEEFHYYSASPREKTSSSDDDQSSMNGQPPSTANPGVMDQVMSEFGDNVQLLKGAAMSSLVGFIRDALRENAPGMYQEYERLRRERDTKLIGGPQLGAHYTAA
jgi:hypothetical protein